MALTDRYKRGVCDLVERPLMGFIGNPGRISREGLSRVLFRVVGTAIQWTAVEVVVAGTTVVVTALSVDTAPVSRGYTCQPEKA